VTPYTNSQKDKNNKAY